MIAVDRATLRRGGASLLSEVCLDVGPEVVVLVGPSGAGKTTLLRVLLGLDALSEGSVTVGGRVATQGPRIVTPPEDRNVAMVFQDLALWPHLTVHGNLAFGLRARGVPGPERARRIRDALGWVGLQAEASRLPGELSGGERQRVAIARALVLDPAAVLLDEPLGSLDVALKSDLLRLLRRLLSERRLPAVYVTHDPFEARRIADRLVVLERGRIAQAGPFDDVVRAPATPFVEAFANVLLGS